MMTSATAHAAISPSPGIGTRIRQGVTRDMWVATAWISLLVAAVYASAKATPWLYPTATQRSDAAEAINASPGIVALYGPILDTHSLGELAMTKMTVLYAVLVAVMCAVIVRRRVRNEGQAAAPTLMAAITEAASLSILLGTLAAVASVAGGLPVLGSVAFGASWAGIGLVATTLTAAVSQLPYNPRASGRITVVAIGLLFALRALGDGLPLPWLSWLSPFGWSTRVEAWSTPRWWVLSLYGAASVGLAALALLLNDKRNREGVPSNARSRTATSSQRRGQLSQVIHRDAMALGVWTVATGAMSTYFAMIAPDINALLGSSHARELIHRLGGAGPLSAALIGAELSIAAAVVTAFGITVFTHASTRPSGEWAFCPTVTVALAGSTWLLFVTGVMFTAGHVVAGGSATTTYIAAALNHAPAVWTLVAMTAAAWTFRPRWAAAGWGLLALFTALGQAGKLVGLPKWMTDFSPYARIALMPVEHFQVRSTIALTAGSLVLLAIAAYNHSRREATVRR
jgi:ABC-2 type transport system permease protein